MQINILDLFSGIGGFSLAAKRAGFTIEKHYASEIDKYAKYIYRYQFPNSVQLGDVTKIGDEHGKIDIITGGFPCQTFSIAGKREGFGDTRGTLFFEIERLAGIYKPKYMVLENVKGLLNHDGGNTIRVVLDKLRGLSYSVQLMVINTVDLGIPQNRERCFFICTASGECQPQISHIREAKRENTFSANCIDANYSKGIDNHGQRTCVGINTKQQGKTNIMNEQSQCLTANMYKEPVMVGYKKTVQAVLTPNRTKKRQNGRRLKNNEEAMFTLTSQDQHGVKIGTWRTHKDGAGFREVKSFNCPTIPARAREDGSGQPVICFVENQRDEIREMDISPTLQANSSGRVGQSPPVVNDAIIRRLTPVECERLQDYQDNWTEYGINDNGEQVRISDTQRYKTLGNSITVKVAEEIFKTIKEAICQ